MCLKKNILKLLVIICLLIYISLLCCVITFNHVHPSAEHDAVLVLGHSINKDNLPGDWLTKRLSDAIYLYTSGYADKIIVSGGKGPNDNIAVADSMRDYLLSNGVPIYDIYLEDEAGNTYENFKFSKLIAQNEKINSIIIVTNDFHMFRSSLICDTFFEDYSTYCTDLKFDIDKLLAYLKEPFSIIKFYFILIIN